MTRLVKHSATGPAIVKTQHGDQVAICRCGLTTNEDGTCCGNHKKIVKEDSSKLYCYDQELKPHEYNCNCNCNCDCNCNCQCQ